MSREVQMLLVNVSTFIESFSSWAGRQSDIEAVALVGSHAREDANEDSDIDLVISHGRTRKTSP